MRVRSIFEPSFGRLMLLLIDFTGREWGGNRIRRNVGGKDVAQRVAHSLPEWLISGNPVYGCWSDYPVWNIHSRHRHHRGHAGLRNHEFFSQNDAAMCLMVARDKWCFWGPPTWMMHQLAVKILGSSPRDFYCATRIDTWDRLEMDRFKE